ncbi:ROK family protein [Micromonospora sp. NPDC049282]|uniref:ROK family protein n=1 Tax=Micromonospora sp. NPDC049282 TaxID=3364269 RepID=UPI00371C1E44
MAAPPSTPEAGPTFAVGIEILPYQLVAVLLDSSGGKLGMRRWPIVDMETATVIDQVATATVELVGTTLGIPLPDPRITIGVQIGGPVSTKDGVVLAYANHPTDSLYAGRDYHWREPVPLADLIRRETGCPTVVENDGAAFATLEKHYGVGQETSSFAVVLVRDGVGGGIFLNNRLMTIPFEFGHIKVQPEGRWCVSGDRGCIDAYAGRRAVRAIAGEVIGAESDLESIEAAIAVCEEGDIEARQVIAAFRQAGAAVGHGIATVLSLFGLSHMVIYGLREMVDPRSGRKAAEAFAAGLNSFPSLTYPLYRSAQVITRAMDVADGAQAAGLVAVDRLIRTCN